MAPSTWRRLLMQAFCCEVVRALTKLGIAIAANRPMMATTIMISTRVKPDFLDVLLFILTFYLSFSRREQSSRRGILVQFPFTKLPPATALVGLADQMPNISTPCF